MEITREHYNQLIENAKATRHLMSESDFEVMRLKLNQIRKDLAFKDCVSDWKEGKTVHAGDFVIICETVGMEIPESTVKWINSDLMEIGRGNYSSIGKITKRQENALVKLGFELTSRLQE